MKISLVAAGVLFVVVALVSAGTVGPAFGGEVHLSLREAVDVALERNLGLTIARLSADASEGDVQRAEGAFDANLSASLNEGENRYESATELQGTGIVSDRNTDWNVGLSKAFEPGTRVDLMWENSRYKTNVPFAILNPGYTSTLSLSVTQPLLKGRGTAAQTAGVRSAEQRLAAAGSSVDDAAAQLIADVKKAYWELVFARGQMDVIRLTLTLAETLYNETREKIEVGVLAPVEIHLPAAEIAKREEQLILGEKAIGDAEDTMKLLMNAESWEGEIIPTDSPETNPDLPPLEGVLEQALSARKDVKAARENLKALTIARESAENNLLPDLAVSGGLVANGLDGDYGGALDDLDRTGVYSWGVGLSLAVPLENNRAKGELLRARAEEAQAEAALELLKQEVARSVQEAVRNARLALKGIDAARKTALASKKGLEAEKAKFEVGLSTTNDVLIVQESYARALNGEQRALVAFQQAIANLERVQGGEPGNPR